jgi:hypothetical protein
MLWSTTAAGNPAYAAYAAIATAALPVLAQAIPLDPSERAIPTDTAASRSLKEPVGLIASFFIHTSA